MVLEPLANRVKAHLRDLATGLGTADPNLTLGPLLDRTFAKPSGAPDYQQNWLVPYGLPLELSFSEASDNVLRLDLEPFDVRMSPRERRLEATQVFRELI